MTDHILPPPVRDTGPLETMARAITPEVLKASEYYCDVPPEHVWSRPRYGHLKDHATLIAQAALTAIAEAGMVIVPREPTQDMVSAGIIERHEQPTPEAWSLATSNIYRAMIAAAPPIDTKEGE